jgi:ubiquinone/menaquinone biosynthesis C-methylase UbiE
MGASTALRDAGLTAGMRVLDLGSGEGDLALLAAEIVGPEGRVLGVERSPARLAAAQARVARLGLDNVEIVEGDVTELPKLGGRPFDAVIGRRVLMHVPDASAVLRAAAALTRPGGPVVAIGHDADCAPHLSGAFVAAGLPAPRLRPDTARPELVGAVAHVAR